MKNRPILLLLLLLLFPVIHVPSGAAEKAPAVELLGSAAAACHLATHLQAYTDGWDGALPSSCPDEGCVEYGHVHCYGIRVSLWDTPKKGPHRVPYYAGTMDAVVGPQTEFQLTDVVVYRGKFYANIRIINERGYVSNSGFVNADYIGCDCESYGETIGLPVYDSYETFSLD